MNFEKNMIKANFVDRYDSRNKLFPWLPHTSLQNNINKIYQFKGNTQTEKRSDCFHVLVSKRELDKVLRVLIIIR